MKEWKISSAALALIHSSYRFLSVVCFCVAWTAASEASEPQNVILIMADDVSPDMFGCYGSEEAKTPHLDRMAAEGVAFRTAWATAMCSPTRAMVMTGRYATRTGFYHNALKTSVDSQRVNLVGNHLTFGRLLKDGGYTTAIAGKWHVTGDSPHSEHGGFQEYSLWEGPKELAALPDRPEFTGLWENETTPSRYWHPCVVQNGKLLKTTPTDFGPEIHTTFLSDFIRRHRDQKFFAYFPMAAPHGTRKGQTTCPLRGEPGDLGRRGSKDNRVRFRALIDYVDVCVGRLWQTVVDEGLADRTVLIFTSDNGSAVNAKTRAVERGARVPLIVYGAGIQQRGMSDELTDLTDILPTLLELARMELPVGYEIDGRSLLPYLTGTTDRHREWIHSAIAASQLLRDKRWLLEAVNPLLGQPRGRFYDTQGNRDGQGYRDVTNSQEPDVLAARARFDEILRQFPPLTEVHPVWNTRAGKRFLATYETPDSMAKHLHHHKDYEYNLVP